MTKETRSRLETAYENYLTADRAYQDARRKGPLSAAVDAATRLRKAKQHLDAANREAFLEDYPHGTPIGTGGGGVFP